MGGGKRGLANIIESNKSSKKNKAQHAKFPELDDLVCDFINRSELFLSYHGFGLCWSVIQVQALEFAKVFNERNIMNDEYFRNFKASKGWICRLRRRKDLKLINLQGELNKTSVEACENFMSAFRDNLKALMEDHDIGEELVFKADQSNLYFKRFPCTTSISKEQSHYV